MNLNQILRDVRCSREGANWDISDIVKEMSDAKDKFCRELGTGISGENLEVILSDFNPIFNVIKHYAASERKSLSLQQQEYWWKACSADIAKILRDLELIGLEQPHKFLNYVRRQLFVFETFRREYEKLRPDLQKDLQAEVDARKQLNGFSTRLQNEYNDLMCVEHALQSKVRTIVHGVADLSLQLQNRWRNPNGQRRNYLQTLEGITETANKINDKVADLEPELNIQLTYFAESTEFFMTYFGKYSTLPQCPMLSKMRNFESSLAGLKDRFEINSEERHSLDAKVLINAGKNYISEALKVTRHIHEYSKSLMSSIDRLVTKSNLAHDEKARVDKILPMYVDDIAEYQEAFALRRSVNMSIRDYETVLEECLTRYTEMNKPPEEIEEMFEAEKENYAAH